MDDFCGWWRNLPTDMKKGKALAWKSYQKARRRATAGEISDGTERYIRHKPQWQHFAHASTFLNQERWTDEYAGCAQDDIRKKYRNWLETCPHTPKCGHPTSCQILKDVAAYKVSKGLDNSGVVGNNKR
jgi:hypothetical protein